jgi:hypothetical protein
MGARLRGHPLGWALAFGGLLVACARIASLGPSDGTDPRPDTVSEGTSGTVPTAPSGSAVGPGAPGGPDSGRAPDTGVPDVAPGPTCLPPKKADGLPCETPSDCCSNHCREDKQCSTTCELENGSCPFKSTDDCCVGLWCGGLARTRCIPCNPTGGPAETDLAGLPLPESCCSRHADFLSGNCIP